MTWGRADRGAEGPLGWPPVEPGPPPKSDADRAFRLASALMRLGLSRAAVEGLLGSGDHARIERQLAYLPYRRARDPAAFLLAAIRGDWSRPPTFPEGREARLEPYRPEPKALDSAPANPYLREPPACDGVDADADAVAEPGASEFALPDECPDECPKADDDDYRGDPDLTLPEDAET